MATPRFRTPNDKDNLDFKKSSTMNIKSINGSGGVISNDMLKKKGFQRRDTVTSVLEHETERAISKFVKVQKANLLKKVQVKRLKKTIKGEPSNNLELTQYLEKLSSEESESEEVEEEDWKNDLGKNLGDITKSVIPDFGYQEYMSFSDDNDKPKNGWVTFLECIKKYPLKSNVQKVIKTINKEKVISCFLLESR